MTASFPVVVRATVGTFSVSVNTSYEAGSVVAVVGPNGAGKTTLLRALAGLVPTVGPSGVRPGVGWVPQEGALFPHLTALDNVAFGVGGRRGRTFAAKWLQRLEISDLAARKPSALSGGQAAKVALARALARVPDVLLLDEPLASLDVAARVDVRRTLRRHLGSFEGVTLLVTHDPVDVMTLATHVLALDGGQVVQDGTVAEVLSAPRTPWLAELMGGNGYYASVAADGALALRSGGVLVSADPVGAPGAGADVLAVVPAHAVTLHRAEPEGSARNAWPAVVRDLTPLGSRVRVALEGRPPVLAEVTAASVADLGLHEGVEVWASVKATEVTVVLL